MRKLTGFMLLLALLTVAAGSCIIARAEAAVSAMAWDFDGRYLAVGKSDGTIEIADMARNQVAQRFKQATRVTAIAWTLDGKSLASAGEDGSVILWDPGQGTRVRQVVQHPYSLRHLFFNRTGTIIFGADSSEIARAYAWDLASGSLLPIFSTGTVQTFAWNNRHDAIASIRLADIEIRDATTLAVVQRIQLPTNPSSIRAALYDIGAALWSRDDKYLILGSINGRVRVWDLSQDRLVTEIQGNDAPRLSTETSSIRGLSYSPSGSHLYSLSVDGTFRVWNTTDYSVVATEQLAAPSFLEPQWSRFGGRLVYVPANAASLQSDTIDGVMVMVPYANLDDVQSLIKQCIGDVTVRDSLEMQASVNLSQLVSSIRQVPEGTIPPACAADLIAIAEALETR